MLLRRAWAVGSYSLGTSPGGTPTFFYVSLNLLSDHQNHPVLHEGDSPANFVICNLGINQGDERPRPSLPPLPRRRQAQVRPGQREEPREAELPPQSQLRPLAPQPARLQHGRRQDEAEGTAAGGLPAN